jgi:predicted TIM-barrel fold metal-dependent hydrolase
LIAAHFGGYTEWDESMKWLVGQDIYFDTSSTLEWLPLDKANKMIRAHGVEKFLFASDFPMWDHEEELERFNRLDLTDEEREMILHKNAEKLLNI